MISFTLFQAPHFLYVIKGIKFNLSSLVLLLFLRSIEWFNFIMLLSFIISLLAIINKNVHKENLKIIFLQMGKPLPALIRPMMFLSVCYSMSFFLMDGFLVPKAHFELKKMFIEISKDKFISSIQPKHFMPYRDWSFTVQKRLSEKEVTGFLLNKENDPEMTLLVKNVYFTNKALMKLRLNDGVGKLTHQGGDIIIRFKQGQFIGPSSMVKANKNIKDYTVFELKNFNAIAGKFRMFFVGLIVPFFIFAILFGGIKHFFGALFFFILILALAMDAIQFNIYVFIASMVIIYYIYRNLIKKMKVL